MQHPVSLAHEVEPNTHICLLWSYLAFLMGRHHLGWKGTDMSGSSLALIDNRSQQRRLKACLDLLFLSKFAWEHSLRNSTQKSTKKSDLLSAGRRCWQRLYWSMLAARQKKQRRWERHGSWRTWWGASSGITTQRSSAGEGFLEKAEPIDSGMHGGANGGGTGSNPN